MESWYFKFYQSERTSLMVELILIWATEWAGYIYLLQVEYAEHLNNWLSLCNKSIKLIQIDLLVNWWKREYWIWLWSNSILNPERRKPSGKSIRKNAVQPGKSGLERISQGVENFV